jgi:phosphocarrier protein HPr
MTTRSPHDPVPKTNVVHTGCALLTNDVGLHARPSVKLTQLAKRFGAHIEFARTVTGPWVDAKSPVKVMRFKAAKGETLHFRASGSDAAEALAAIVALVERGFAIEGEEAPKPQQG